MTAAQSRLARPSWWTPARARYVTIGGVAIALISLALQLPLFLQDGPVELLRGLLQQLFVMVLLLLATVSTRTVSLGLLGIAFLVGALPVMAVALLLEFLPAQVFGYESAIVSMVWVPIVEELIKLLPVGLYFAYVVKATDRQPAITDGLLLGFAVGAGFAFYEDGLAGGIAGQGDGWFDVVPWSLLLPTLSRLGDFVIGNHALWTATAGLGLAAAFFFRPRRWAWVVAAVALLLAILPHMVFNYFSGDFGGLLGALGRGEVPPLVAVPQLLLVNGFLPIVALLVGIAAVVAFELRSLAWVAAREPTFPSVALRDQLRLLGGATRRAGFAPLQAVDLYVRRLRSVYYAAWRTENVGVVPLDARAEIEELAVLAEAAGLAPKTAPPPPVDVVAPATPA